MSANPQSKKPPGRFFMVGIVAAIALAFYFKFTYSGPFKLLAEWQLEHFESYTDKYTFLVTFLVIVALGAAIFWPLSFLLPRRQVVGDDSASTTRPSANRDYLLVVLLFLGFAGFGAFKIYQARSAGTLTDVSAADLEKGKAFPRWARIHGILVPDAAIGFGESGGTKTPEKVYTPVVSTDLAIGGPRDQRPQISLFVESSGSKSDQFGTGEITLTGTLTSGDLPGPIRVAFEKASLTPSANYVVLEYNNDPANDEGIGKIFVIGGLGVAATALVWGLMKNRMRKRNIAAVERW